MPSPRGTPRFFGGLEKQKLAGEAGELHGIKKFWTYLEETALLNGSLSGIQ